MTLWRLREAVGRVRGTAGRTTFGRAAAGRQPLAGFDHADYATLVERFVGDDGLVDYDAWKQDTASLVALDDYLNRLGRTNPMAGGDRADRLAFWVNAYNAGTLAGVLRDYPAGCACRRGSWVGFSRFRDVRLWVGSTCLSLDRIEHGVLRPMGEPLTHFALVCGARGCPPLRAYKPTGLTDQLAGITRRFFARPDTFQADRVTRTLKLSRLLKWYGRDFARTSAGIVRAIRPYFPDADLGWLDAGPVRLVYLPYDWALNDRALACKAGS